MGTDEEFSAFVAARADHLYRQAWLLTGTRQAAEDLVQTALTKTDAPRASGPTSTPAPAT